MAKQHYLIHLLHEFVNVSLAVSGITTLSKTSRLTDEATIRRAQLEGPQEVVHFLEVRSTSEDFVNYIFDAGNAKRREASYSNEKDHRHDLPAIMLLSTKGIRWPLTFP